MKKIILNFWRSKKRRLVRNGSTIFYLVAALISFGAASAQANPEKTAEVGSGANLHAALYLPVERPLAAIIAARSAQAPIKVVLFRADWCRSCKQLEASTRTAQAQLRTSDVRWYVFDMTNDRTRRQSEILAQRADLQNIYSRFSPDTGLLPIVN